MGFLAIYVTLLDNALTWWKRSVSRRFTAGIMRINHALNVVVIAC